VPALQQAGYRVITYDRRGFGRSDKPKSGYSYETLTEDLHAVLTGLDLDEVTLVGFSMGGGEVARYFAKYGAERLHSVVFASAVTPSMMQSADNPDGPLTEAEAAKMHRSPRGRTPSTTTSPRSSARPTASSRSPRPSARRRLPCAGRPARQPRSPA
jgi:pimeloyl-ACP methyl ester carboxylesterase